MRELATAGFFFPARTRAAFRLPSLPRSVFALSRIHGRVCFGKRLFSFLAAGASIQYGALQSEIYENILQRLSSDIGLTFLVDNVLIALLIKRYSRFSFGDTSIETKTLNRILIVWVFNGPLSTVC